MLRFFSIACLLFALSGLSCRESESAVDTERVLDRRQELAAWIKNSVQEKIDANEICIPTLAPSLLMGASKQDQEVLSSTAQDVFSWEVQDVAVIHDDGPRYIGMVTLGRTLTDADQYSEAMDAIATMAEGNEWRVRAMFSEIGLGSFDMNSIYDYEMEVQASVAITADEENAFWESAPAAFLGCSQYDGASMVKVMFVWMYKNGLLR